MKTLMHAIGVLITLVVLALVGAVSVVFAVILNLAGIGLALIVAAAIFIDAHRNKPGD